METVLKVENLKKKYKNFTAVNGISFEVKESEIVQTELEKQQLST